MSQGRIDAYVRALVGIASAEGALAETASELYQMANALESNESLRSTLADKSVPAVHRQAVVESLLSDKAGNITVQLVSMIVGAGRARDLPEIARAFAAQSSQSAGGELAEVRSAVALSDDQRKRLEAALSKKLDKKVDVRVIVDPKVVGGLVATVGDEVIDGSVRSHLDQLKGRL